MKNKIQFTIGCSAFSNKHWKDIFYPEKLPQNKWFEFYCEHFDSLELNGTFYRFPTAQSLQTWFKRSPDHFVFSVKAPKTITHLKKFDDCEADIRDFYIACQQGLEDKLGCLLFQFPPSFDYSKEKLQKIIAGLNPDFKNVVEFRHKSWWTESVYAEFASHHLIFCSVSYPNLPETILAPTATVYVRLHGVPKLFYSDYAPEALRQLHQNILEQDNITAAYVYFNNTASAAGVLNAQQMQLLIAAAPPA